MRYLGLDLGSKTLGISISDRTGLIASVYKTLFFAEDNYDELYDEIRCIVSKEDISKVILGFPKNMDNSLGKRADITLAFKEKLESVIGVPVILEDERLTSVISNNILISADMSRKKRKKKVDGLSAVIILQCFLDRENKERK